MQFVQLKCPACAAALPPRAAAGHYTCDYCGTTFAASSTPSVQLGAARPRPAATGLIAVIAGMAVVSSMVAGIFAYTGSGMSLGGPNAQTGKSGERLLWDEVGGPPTPVEIAGSRAVLGRVRAVSDGDKLYVAAFDAGSLDERWRIGPLGTYSDGYQHTIYGVSGEHVLVADARSTLHIHALADGSEQKAISLSDRVELVCKPEAPGKLWIAQVDERKFMLDLAAGTLAEAPDKPKPCTGARQWGRWSDDDMREDDAPKVDGFRAQRVIVDGDLAVAAGTKAPGTAIPHAVGFDPRTKAVRWHEIVPSADPATVRERSNEHDALAHGKYFVVWGTGSDRWHVSGFDARSGVRLWDTQMSDIFAVDSIEDVVATDQHVFVVRTSSLDVYRVADGSLVGAIGTETYE